MLFTLQSSAQRIENFADFEAIDTLTTFNEWQHVKEYYGADSIHYEVRYKIWGEGCQRRKFETQKEKKCKFYIQEQLWIQDGSHEWKHGIKGHTLGKEVDEQQLFVWYSKSGKVAQKTKKKDKYSLK